jgi:hypothetical protein
MHECDYNTYDCNFISDKSVFYTQSVILTRKVWFWHLKCDYDTHECAYDTHEVDLYMHEMNFNSMRVTLTRTYSN